MSRLWRESEGDCQICTPEESEHLRNSYVLLGIKCHSKCALFSSTIAILPIRFNFYAESQLHFNNCSYKKYSSVFLLPCISRQKYCSDSNNNFLYHSLSMKRKCFVDSLSLFIFTMPCQTSVLYLAKNILNG